MPVFRLLLHLHSACIGSWLTLYLFPLKASRLGMIKKLGENIVKTSDLKWPNFNGIPCGIVYHMISFSAIKALGKKEKEMFVVLVFVFPSNHCTCFPENDFASVIKHSLSQCIGLFAFLQFLWLLPKMTESKKRCVFGCWLVSTQHIH